MEIGEKYIHRYTPHISCEIEGFTENGYRVQLTDGKKKPKRGFFYRADFDVKNGFWIKENQSNATSKNQSVESNELKFPTLEDFLERISTDNVYKKKDAEMFDIELSNRSRLYFYSDFSVDGIHVRIRWSKWREQDCSITVSGLKAKKFSSDSYDGVMKLGIKWLYDTFFKYTKNEKSEFKVYKQGYLGFDYYEFPQYFEFVGTHAQTNYDYVITTLEGMGFDMKTLFIEKVLYNYQNFKTELLKLDL